MGYSRTGQIWLVILLSVAFVPFEKSGGADCNVNDVEDAVDIATGTSVDCNLNGLPDECDLSPTIELGDIETYPIDVASNAVAIATGHLDEDNHVDIATANFQTSDVSILVNDGDGTFTTSNAHPAVGDSPLQIIIADLNGDTRPDIATANRSGANVSIMPNLGGGNFGTAIDVDVGFDAFGLAAVDLDGVETLDLVVAGGSNNLRVLYNVLGTTPRVNDLMVGAGPVGVTAARLDGDELADVVVANQLGGSVLVLVNDGFGVLVHTSPIITGGQPVAVGAVDLDNDSHNDLAVANWELHRIQIFWNNGSGSFGAGPEIVVPPGPFTIDSADLNGDTVLDLVTASEGIEVVSAIHNNGDRTFRDTQDFSTAGEAFRVSVVDLSNDGLPDIAATNGFGGTVAVFLNETREASLDTNDDGILDECSEQLPGDCNQDARLNIADAVCGLGVLFVGEPQGFPCGGGSLDHPGDIALIDWQPDGQIDISDPISLLLHLFASGPAHALATGGQEPSCVFIAECPGNVDCD